MVDATLEDAFPFFVFLGEVFLAEVAEDKDGSRPIEMALHRVLQQAAEPQKAGGSDSGGGSIVKLAAFRRRHEIPWRNAVGIAVRDVVVGAGFRGIEEARIAAVLVGHTEPVERPSEPARPAGIAAITLLRGLALKLPRLEI